MTEGGYHGNMNYPPKGLEGLAPRRKAAGYTQETFAAALGITRSLLAAWETGRAWPSARRLPDMARLLGCGIPALYAAPPGNDIIPQEGEADHAGQLQEYLL